MKLNDTMLRLRGLWTFTFYEGDKEYGIDPDTGLAVVLNPIVLQRTYWNLITTVGKQFVLDRVFGLSAVAALTNTGVGTSNTAAAVGNTTLTGATWKGYASTPVRTAEAVAATTSFTTAEANIVIAEAALSNGSPATSAGTILNRLVVGPFTKSAAVALDISTTITQS